MYPMIATFHIMPATIASEPPFLELKHLNLNTTESAYSSEQTQTARVDELFAKGNEEQVRLEGLGTSQKALERKTREWKND